MKRCIIKRNINFKWKNNQEKIHKVNKKEMKINEGSNKKMNEWMKCGENKRLIKKQYVERTEIYRK